MSTDRTTGRSPNSQSEPALPKMDLKLDDRSTSDVTLLVRGKPIYAHRAVLQENSSYMRALLNVQSPDADGQYKMNEFDFETIHTYLEYVYTKKVEFYEENNYRFSHYLPDDEYQVDIEKYLQETFDILYGQKHLSYFEEFAIYRKSVIVTYDNVSELLYLSHNLNFKKIEKRCHYFRRKECFGEYVKFCDNDDFKTNIQKIIDCELQLWTAKKMIECKLFLNELKVEGEGNYYFNFLRSAAKEKSISELQVIGKVIKHYIRMLYMAQRDRSIEPKKENNSALTQEEESMCVRKVFDTIDYCFGRYLRVKITYLNRRYHLYEVILEDYLIKRYQDITGVRLRDKVKEWEFIFKTWPINTRLMSYLKQSLLYLGGLGDKEEQSLFIKFYTDPMVICKLNAITPGDEFPLMDAPLLLLLELYQYKQNPALHLQIVHQIWLGGYKFETEPFESITRLVSEGSDHVFQDFQNLLIKLAHLTMQNLGLYAYTFANFEQSFETCIKFLLQEFKATKPRFYMKYIKDVKNFCDFVELKSTTKLGMNQFVYLARTLRKVIVKPNSRYIFATILNNYRLRSSYFYFD